MWLPSDRAMLCHVAPSEFLFCSVPLSDILGIHSEHPFLGFSTTAHFSVLFLGGREIK